MMLLKGLCLTFLLLSSALVSSASFADEAISLKKNNSSRSDWPVNSKIYIGYGVFQDLHIPVSSYTDSRIDGSQVKPDLQTQGGILAGAELQVASPKDAWQSLMNLKAQKVTNMNVNDNSPDSTYANVGAEIGIRYSQFSQSWYLDALLGFQREYFTNISTGHQLEALYPKMRLNYKFQSGSVVSAYGAVMAQSNLLFDNGDRAVKLSKSNTAGQSLGAGYDLAISSDSAISFGAEMNQNQVVISDLRTYEEAGFEILGVASSSRSIKLTTTLVNIGIVTVW